MVNLSTGLVTMPVGNQVTVEVVVTFTKGVESKSITTSLLIGEGAPINVSQAKKSNWLCQTTSHTHGLYDRKHTNTCVL